MTDAPWLCEQCSLGIPCDGGYRCRTFCSPSAGRVSCSWFRKRTRPYKARTNFGHDGLVHAAIRWLRNGHAQAYTVDGTDAALGWLGSHSVVITELPTSSETPDAIGFGGPGATLIECKQSRSDFLADLRKPTRMPGGICMGSLRYYLTPLGLLRPGELPDGWGLLESTERGVQIVKPARLVTTDRAVGAEIALLASVICRLRPAKTTGLTVRWTGERLDAKPPQASVTVELLPVDPSSGDHL